MVKERDFGLITGNDAKINGYKEITVTTDENIVLDQSGTEVKVKLNTNNFQAPITGTPGKIASFDDNGNIISVDPVAINPDAPLHPNIELYGFIIDMNESNPESMITYINDNANYRAARMGSSSFDYGDWANAFFIKNLRPCMLRYNGTVAYDLNKNDYSKKADGTASDIANESFAGNAMVGIPTVWIKINNLGNDQYKVQFSSYQLDPTFHAYAHHDSNDNIMPYTYLAAYNSWIDSHSRLRSLSGKIPDATNSTASIHYEKDQILAARKNNPSGIYDLWDIEKFVDRNLINLLLMLIGKTTNTQAAFGYGNAYGALNPASGASGQRGVLPNGALNDKGLFYGEVATNQPMKVFGIENWWGSLERRVMGVAQKNGHIYYKLTRSTADGSTVNGFYYENPNDPEYGTSNPDYDPQWYRNIYPVGWIDGGELIASMSQQYITKIKISDGGAILPVAWSGGSGSTYFCDTISSVSSSSQLCKLGIHGGMSSLSDMCGAFYQDYRSGDLSCVDSTLSCKPTVTT